MISEANAERGIDCTFFRTSIWDETLYKVTENKCPTTNDEDDGARGSSVKCNMCNAKGIELNGFSNGSYVTDGWHICMRVWSCLRLSADVTNSVSIFCHLMPSLLWHLRHGRPLYILLFPMSPSWSFSWQTSVIFGKSLLSAARLAWGQASPAFSRVSSLLRSRAGHKQL